MTAAQIASTTGTSARALLEPGGKGCQLGIEVTPDCVVLGLEIPEECSATDAGGGGDLVDGGHVEALVGEHRQRDLLQLGAAGDGRAAEGSLRGRWLAGSPSLLSLRRGLVRQNLEQSSRLGPSRACADTDP